MLHSYWDQFPCKEEASREDKGEHAKRMPEPTRHTRQLWFHGKYNTWTVSITRGRIHRFSWELRFMEDMGPQPITSHCQWANYRMCIVLLTDSTASNGSSEREITIRRIFEYRYIKSNPITGLDRPWGFQEIEVPRFQDNRHIKVVRLSAVRTGRLENVNVKFTL
jgi:hypothetical protein